MKITPNRAWDGQDDMAVVNLGKYGLFHFGYPVINIDLAAAQAEP
jgi:hypothetical protein